MVKTDYNCIIISSTASTSSEYVYSITTGRYKQCSMKRGQSTIQNQEIFGISLYEYSKINARQLNFFHSKDNNLHLEFKRIDPYRKVINKSYKQKRRNLLTRRGNAKIR